MGLTLLRALLRACDTGSDVVPMWFRLLSLFKPILPYSALLLLPAFGLLVEGRLEAQPRHGKHGQWGGGTDAKQSRVALFVRCGGEGWKPPTTTTKRRSRAEVSKQMPFHSAGPVGQQGPKASAYTTDQTCDNNASEALLL